MRPGLFDLKGRVIVVTGATGLLGRQHADAIAAAKGIPILLDLHSKPIDELSQSIYKKYGVKAIGHVVDIIDENAVRQNVKAIIDCFGKIDALINNNRLLVANTSIIRHRASKARRAWS